MFVIALVLTFYNYKIKVGGFRIIIVYSFNYLLLIEKQLYRVFSNVSVEEVVVRRSSRTTKSIPPDRYVGYLQINVEPRTYSETISSPETMNDMNDDKKLCRNTFKLLLIKKLENFCHYHHRKKARWM